MHVELDSAKSNSLRIRSALGNDQEPLTMRRTDRKRSLLEAPALEGRDIRTIQGKPLSIRAHTLVSKAFMPGRSSAG
jgi:hypothetical protein